ncbi:uncharacterized protein I206_107747 [Kwoniella pini CBS 10737]|uniref:Uncharacterized protein n=1 Tax=Kwoniella pini CBS 10737 TaxID=1296096 RepID=A0A1B9HY50_9TREE|nr:uncharacterized protein I206_06081 [Kwoniella pini CBS 10737]OCF48213.1 hypothetical protein I206_06081 [Kwoniella pini CBS 10737]
MNTHSQSSTSHFQTSNFEISKAGCKSLDTIRNYLWDANNSKTSTQKSTQGFYKQQTDQHGEEYEGLNEDLNSETNNEVREASRRVDRKLYDCLTLLKSGHNPYASTDNDLISADTKINNSDDSTLDFDAVLDRIEEKAPELNRDTGLVTYVLHRARMRDASDPPCELERGFPCTRFFTIFPLSEIERKCLALTVDKLKEEKFKTKVINSSGKIKFMETMMDGQLPSFRCITRDPFSDQSSKCTAPAQKDIANIVNGLLSRPKERRTVYEVYEILENIKSEIPESMGSEFIKPSKGTYSWEVREENRKRMQLARLGENVNGINRKMLENLSYRPERISGTTDMDVNWHDWATYDPTPASNV